MAEQAPRSIAALLLLLALPAVSIAELSAATYPGVALAPQSAAVLSTVACDPSCLPPGTTDFSAVRLTGTITPPADDAALNFTALSDGGVRLWVDDFLLIDAGALHNDTPSARAAFQTIAVKGGAPLALRLEYSRWSSSGTPPTLELSWSGAQLAPQQPGLRRRRRTRRAQRGPP